VAQFVHQFKGWVIFNVNLYRGKKFKDFLTDSDINELYSPSNTEPKLFKVREATTEKFHESASLPKDFFSQLIHHTANLIPVEEGHPDFDRDDLFSQTDFGEEEMDLQKIDLPTMWNIHEERTRGLSEATRPKMRTLSEPVLKKVSANENNQKMKKGKIYLEDTNEEAPEWLPEERNNETVGEEHRFRAKSDTTEKESIAIRHSHEKLN